MTGTTLKTLRRAASAGSIGLAAGVALASGAGALTIEQALIEAYRNSPQLAAQRAAMRALDEQVNLALAGRRPQVTVDGSTVARRLLAAPPGSSNRGWSSTYPAQAGISVSQNIYRGGRDEAAAARADEDVLSGRARLSAVEQQVLLSALVAYVDVVRDGAVVDLNVNNEKVLKRQLDAVSDRFRVGEVTRTDVALARSRLSRATADLVRSRGDLADSRATFADVVGVPADGLKEVQPVGGLPKSEQDALAQARADSFAVVQARHNERSAKHRVQEILSEFRPTVSVSGALRHSFDLDSPDPRNSNVDQIEVTGRVTVPLYQSGVVSSRVRAAKHTAVQRRNEFAQAVRTTAADAAKRWKALETARAGIEAYSEAVRAAKIALEGVEQEAQVGSRTVLHVLDAEQELLDARVGRVLAHRNFVVASYALRQAVGQLTARSLDLDVELYDPRENYNRTRERWRGVEIAE